MGKDRRKDGRQGRIRKYMRFGWGALGRSGVLLKKLLFSSKFSESGKTKLTCR